MVNMHCNIINTNLYRSLRVSRSIAYMETLIHEYY